MCKEVEGNLYIVLVLKKNDNVVNSLKICLCYIVSEQCMCGKQQSNFNIKGKQFVIPLIVNDNDE